MKGRTASMRDTLVWIFSQGVSQNNNEAHSLCENLHANYSQPTHIPQLCFNISMNFLPIPLDPYWGSKWSTIFTVWQQIKQSNYILVFGIKQCFKLLAGVEVLYMDGSKNFQINLWQSCSVWWYSSNVCLHLSVQQELCHIWRVVSSCTFKLNEPKESIRKKWKRCRPW